MSQEQEDEVVVSEPSVEANETDNADTDTTKMVPLKALQAERQKRQDLEVKAQAAEAKAQMYQEYMQQQQASKQPEPEEDPSGLVEKGALKEMNAATKREIYETIFQDTQPEAVQKINKYLQPILEKKPWLASTIESAPNRYARAFEIVSDYLHLVETPIAAVKSAVTDGQRIVNNAGKPKSTAEIGRSAQPSGVEYLKSIQGTKEFREYRAKMRQG